MAENEQAEQQEQHKTFAVQLFNLVWDLLDQEERMPEDDDRMVHAAHASRFHWGEIGTPLEWARGEWQISRVYSVLGRSHAAVYHAQRSLALCQENGIGDFDLAFAYEALARGHAVAGDAGKRQEYLELAKGAAEQIEGQEDREYVLSELDTIA